jgi:hypothetical protein
MARKNLKILQEMARKKITWKPINEMTRLVYEGFSGKEIANNSI